jgi:hypothetical protein
MEKEHIKLAMLRQEQTFRQQVNQVANQMLAQRQEQFLNLLPSSLPSGSRATLRVSGSEAADDADAA